MACPKCVEVPLYSILLCLASDKHQEPFFWFGGADFVGELMLSVDSLPPLHEEAQSH